MQRRRSARQVLQTRKRKDGRTEWIPPPHLDTGQARVNNYHHPERYLIPDDNDEDDGRSTTIPNGARSSERGFGELHDVVVE